MPIGSQHDAEHPRHHEQVTQDAQMRFLARSLARDSLDLRRFYTEGRSEQAAYLLHHDAENCVVCHTRLLGSGASPLAERFVAAGVLIEATTGEARAQLQMATPRGPSEGSGAERA